MGALNALFIMPSIIFKTNRNNLEIVAKDRFLPTLNELFNMVLTFFLTVLAWIFFRSANVGEAVSIIGDIFSKSLFTVPQSPPKLVLLIIFILFIVMEWLGRQDKYTIEKMGNTWHPIVRWSFYSCIIFCIGMYMQTKSSGFIYFQF